MKIPQPRILIYCKYINTDEMIHKNVGLTITQIDTQHIVEEITLEPGRAYLMEIKTER